MMTLMESSVLVVVGLSLAAAGFWGIGFACLAQAVAVMGWKLATFIHFAIGSVAYTAMLPILKGKEKIFVRESLSFFKHKYVVMAGICQITGIILLNMAIGTSSNLAAVAIALAGCYPIIAVLLALFKLKEQIQPIPLAGAFGGIVGVIVLTLG